MANRKMQQGGRRAARGRPRAKRMSRGAPGAGGGPTVGRIIPLPSQVKQTQRMERAAGAYFLTQTASDKGYVFTFALSDVPLSSDFTGLYDQYRITRVLLKFSWSPTGAGAFYPTLDIAADYDGAPSVPATQTVLSRRAHVSHSFNPTMSQVTFSIVPRTIIAVGSGLTATGVAKPRQWLNCSDPTTVHNGMVAWIANFNTATAGNIIVEETIFFDVSCLQ